MNKNKIMEEEYSPLKSFLNHEFDIYPDDEELRTIVALSVKQNSHSKNVGIRASRCEHNSREQAFHDQWLKENEPRAGLNSGNGILQDLFIESGNPMSPFSGGKMLEEITDRDRMIVATVIQWLGSNVGMCFLYESLKRFNASIIERTPTIPPNKSTKDF